jgi:hypothetical protein
VAEAEVLVPPCGMRVREEEDNGGREARVGTTQLLSATMDAVLGAREKRCVSAIFKDTFACVRAPNGSVHNESMGWRQCPDPPFLTHHLMHNPNALHHYSYLCTHLHYKTNQLWFAQLHQCVVIKRHAI